MGKERAMSHLARAFLLGAALSAAPVAAQAPQPPALPAGAPAGGTSVAIDPNQVVDVDFASGIFFEPLPFDVPFFLRGNAPAGVQTVAARVLQFPDFVNCAGHQADLDQAPSLGPASVATVSGQLKLLLPVRELEVNKYYCFEFTLLSKLSPEDLTTFQAKAAAAVDAALRPLRQDSPEAQKTRALEDLRAALRTTVKELLGPNQILNPPADSLLGPGPAATVSLRNREEFTQILALQIQRQDALTELRKRQLGAVDALARLIADDAYHKVVSAVAGQRSSHISLDEFLKAKPGASSLANLSRDDLEFVAFGMDRGSPVNLDQVFTSADALALATRLHATADGLDDLRDLVDALIQNQVLRSAAGLDDDDGRTALAALLDRVTAARRALQSDLLAMQNLVKVLAGREVLIQNLTGRLDPLLQNVLRVQATTVSGFQVRASWYISADIGVATASRINEVFGYLGANVYLRPVNKAAHLRWSAFRGHFWRELGKRFAFVIGLPYNDLNKTGERSGLISSRPLIVGAGFRINDLLRLSGGALIFKQNDPNPLIDRQRIGSTPFFSLSVDWDVRSNFTRLFNAATGGPVSP
jgi:hypothetical protein